MDNKVYEKVQGTIIKITPSYALAKIGEKTGLCHITDIANQFINDINDHFKLNESYEFFIKEQNDSKIALSLIDPNEKVRR